MCDILALYVQAIHEGCVYMHSHTVVQEPCTLPSSRQGPVSYLDAGVSEWAAECSSEAVWGGAVLGAARPGRSTGRPLRQDGGCCHSSSLTPSLSRFLPFPPPPPPPHLCPGSSGGVCSVSVRHCLPQACPQAIQPHPGRDLRVDPGGQGLQIRGGAGEGASPSLSRMQCTCDFCAYVYIVQYRIWHNYYK